MPTAIPTLTEASLLLSEAQLTVYHWMISRSTWITNAAGATAARVEWDRNQTDMQVIDVRDPAVDFSIQYQSEGMWCWNNGKYEVTSSANGTLLGSLIIDGNCLRMVDAKGTELGQMEWQKEQAKRPKIILFGAPWVGPDVYEGQLGGIRKCQLKETRRFLKGYVEVDFTEESLDTNARVLMLAACIIISTRTWSKQRVHKTIG